MNKQFLLQNDLENTKSILALAEAQLREILDKLEKNIPPQSIKRTPELDKLFNFSTQYEARILALQTVGEEDNAKQNLIKLVGDMLTDSVLLQEFLANKGQITEGDLRDFASLKLRRLDTVFRLNEAADIATMGEGLKLNDATQFSVDTLLRQITRSVAVDPDFDREVNSFLMRLFYESYKDERVLPIIPRGLNKNSIYSQSFDFADTQSFRDQAGGSIAALIKLVVSGQRLNVFDDVFKNAYSSAVKFLLGIYTMILSSTSNLRRTPEEVEEIKRELLSDIDMPVPPVAPSVQPQASQSPAGQMNSTIKPITPQSMPAVPKPPAPPKPPASSIQNLRTDSQKPIASTNNFSAPTDNASVTTKDNKETGSNSSTPTTPTAPQASQNKGNVTINKIERPAPPKDSINPIQRIDLD